MTISFNLEKKDVEAYYLYEFSKQNRKKFLLYFIIILTIIGININNSVGLHALKIYLAVTTILLLCYPLLAKRTNKLLIKKIIKEKKDTHTNIDFQDDKFLITNDIAKTEILYTNIKNILEVKLYYYIFISNECIIIPKRAISDVDTFNKTIIQPLKNKYYK
jgi:hypothetical protein